MSEAEKYFICPGVLLYRFIQKRQTVQSLAYNSAWTLLQLHLTGCLLCSHVHISTSTSQDFVIFVFYAKTICVVWWSRLAFYKCLVRILGRMPVILRSFKVSLNPPCKCQYGTRTRPQPLPTKSFPVHHLFTCSMLYILRS